MRRLLPLLLLAAAAVASTGCVYRLNIQQGNLVKVEDVDQVSAGMTRSQVRYLLGTPMVSDPFHPDRWDYVFSFKRGRDPKTDTAHFVVYFDGDKVSRVEKLTLQDALPALETVEPPKTPATAAGSEPPAPPSVKQPQPDAPPPSGT